MTTKMWRGGMVGAGAWSDVQLTAWSQVENASIVALADRHSDRRAPIVEQFHIPHAFDDLESMLDAVPLDFVDICVRPYSHAALVKRAASRGLPILCQKPFCTTLQEAQDVVEFCEQRRVPLMVNENWRWQSWYRQAKSLIDAGALGTPFLAKLMQRVRATLPTGVGNQKQAYFAEMPRLALYEVGTHYLDTLRYLFGEPSSVFARMYRVSPYIQGEDVVAVMLGYENFTCLIENSWASIQVPGVDIPEGTRRGPLLSRLEVEGTAGTLALLEDGTLHLYTDSDHQAWSFTRKTVFEESHAAAQQHFVQCLETGAPFETSGAETLKTMALVYAAYLSSEENRVVNPVELLPTFQPASKLSNQASGGKL